MILKSPEYNRAATDRKARKPKRSPVFCINLIGTDTVFMKDCGEQDGLNPQNRAHHRALARAAGVSTSGRYCPELARPGVYGDPGAWVNGRQDVKDFCEQTGKGVSGMVEVNAREAALPEKVDYQPSPKLVDKEVTRINATENEGRMSAQQVADTTEKVAKRMKGNL
jgi:hypothetical protein